MRYHFFLHYGWFLQKLEKDFIRTIMHTTVFVIVIFFEKRYSYIVLASYDLLWFLNRNPFRTDHIKWQILWEKKIRFRRFRIRENMWWNRYRRHSCQRWNIGFVGISSRSPHICKNRYTFLLFDLFVTSKNETTNSPIHEFKVLHE